MDALCAIFFKDRETVAMAFSGFIHRLARSYRETDPQYKSLGHCIPHGITVISFIQNIDGIYANNHNKARKEPAIMHTTIL